MVLILSRFLSTLVNEGAQRGFVGSSVEPAVKHESKCNVCKMYPIVGFRDSVDGSNPVKTSKPRDKEDEEVAREQPVMARPVMDDEHRLIRHYAKRALQGEINNIHYLQRQNQKEHSVIPVEGPGQRGPMLRQQRERLEAREEVLGGA
ncbi:hypothetical protein OS493_039972 [Desmophyllum pertusum]|uniref:Uncharacterized protein n=1 Tax=Desmophyllum pertusum TaxID=174260 RepID=A0A9W9YH14_9CNID|nr:hypothetical protein OS493_039972 [Desmophyllum pertusum]